MDGSGKGMVSELLSSVFDNVDLIRLVLSHVTDVEVIGRAAQCCRALSAHAYSDEVMQPVCKTMEPRLVSGAWLDPMECEVICAPAVLSTNAKVYEEVTARANHHPWWVRTASLVCDSCPSCEHWGSRPPTSPEVRQLQVRVCESCNDIFCPAHAANPRCRTRCGACSGEVICSLCEEDCSGVFSAGSRRIWCHCCLVVCDGCDQRVCASHARSGRCLECLEQDMDQFMIERAAVAHWSALQ